MYSAYSSWSGPALAGKGLTWWKFGAGDTRRAPRKTNRTNVTDERTDDFLVNPGGEIEWSLDTGIAQKIPTVFKHRLKDKNATRIRAKGKALASMQKQKGKTIHPFLIDSGCSVTQVPANMVHLLDDVTETTPVYFETAGGSTPISKLRGTLKFKLKGVDEVFMMNCLVNPGLSKKLCLLSMEDLDNYENENVKCKLYKNVVQCWGRNVSVCRDKYSTALLDLEIISGSSAK